MADDDIHSFIDQRLFALIVSSSIIVNFIRDVVGQAVALVSTPTKDSKFSAYSVILAAAFLAISRPS